MDRAMSVHVSTAPIGTDSEGAQAPLLGYQIHGHGARKVIVLHDWMGDQQNYDAVRPSLDEAKFMFAFADVRGYGLSRSLIGEYTAQEIARDVMRLADHLGWERFDVIGHSMTGMAVQRVAIDDWHSGRRRIQRVIAITPVAADGYPADESTREFLWGLIGEREMSHQGFFMLTGQRLHDCFLRQKVDRHFATSSIPAMRGYFRMWLDSNFATDAIAAAISTPMLVIGGRQDLPGFQESHLRATFGAWYPKAEFQFIEDAGHYPMHETPVLLASLIDEFLTRLD
jgi:pimeloyl-ACP methyl ester carboxylesterase